MAEYQNTSLLANLEKPFSSFEVLKLPEFPLTITRITPNNIQRLTGQPKIRLTVSMDFMPQYGQYFG